MSDPQSTIREAAKAKLNLYLHVTGRRPDGYHKLDTLFAFVEFGDVLAIAQADKFCLVHRGDYRNDLPTPQNNLVWKAAHLLADAYNRDASVRVNLEKRLPIASGLGGGSADAAAVLRGLCTLWGISVNDPAVQDIAANLGADVPVCVFSTAALATGVGDHLQPVALPACGVLLVNPNIPLETRDVFAAFKRSNASFSGQNQPDKMADFDAMVGAMTCRSNDLEQAAIGLQPVIAEMLNAVDQLPGCALARMSGSGASCFGLFKTATGARVAAKVLQNNQPDWWIQPTQISGTMN